MNLEGAVMNVGRWRVRTQEEAMVIRVRHAEIKVRKHRHHMLLTVLHDVQKIGGHDVEMCGVKFE